jgi:ABC-type polysaccharide/polyol phosphate export permease
MNIKDHMRIFWAISSKDIIDAIKNKIVQGVLIGVGFLMLSSQALSLLVGLKEEPTAYYWDQAKSTVFKEIARGRELAIFPRDDLLELTAAVSQSAEPVLGIVIPPDLDDQLESGETLLLQAYYASWVPTTKISEQVLYFEENLGIQTGEQISIYTEGNGLYPPSDGSGYPMMIAFGMVLGVMTIGLILTPYLIVDEKENQTLDALRISPAGTLHILIGKSVVGLFYSLIASSLIFILSWRWVAHWEIILLAVVFGGLAAVSIGLFVGTLIDNPTNVNMGVGLLLAVLLLPMYFWTGLVQKLSPFFQTIFEIIPTIAMYRIVRQSFTEIASIELVWGNLLILVAWILVGLGLLAWRIRNMDR